MLDALLVDGSVPAAAVDALRRWAGGRVAVRIGGDDPDEAWLAELVRAAAEPLQLGDARIDLRRGVVARGDDLVALTDTEALLLAFLATRGGAVVTRGELLQHVWGYHPAMRTRVVDVTVARLRTKLERDPAAPEHLITVRGVGYRLDGAAAPGVEAPPAAPSELWGRDDDWARLLGWVRAGEPLVTLLGPPGIGKTALARAVCAAVPGAVWCALDAAEGEDEGHAALSAALGLPAALPEPHLRRAVVEGDRPLLVIDNAEHLLGLVGRLLDAAPASPVVVTSRVRLGGPAERCLDLAPLAPEPAQALFLARARRVRPDFDAGPETLGALGTLCEGLPLALELAAARVRLLSGADLVRALGQGALARGHKRYDEALASSWALLDPDARALLSRLAALRGALPVALVEALADDPLETLAALDDASLVHIVHTPAGAEVQLLETVRRYVLRTASLGDDALPLARAVAAHVEALDALAVTPPGWDGVRGLARASRATWSAVDLALAAGDGALAVRLGLALTHVYESLGASAGDLAMLRKLGADDLPDAWRVAQLQALVLSMQGEVAEAERAAARCRRLAAGVEAGAEATYTELMVAIRLGRADPAPLLAELDALPPLSRVRAWGALGLSRRATPQGVAWLERSLAEADRLGLGWLQNGTLGVLATAYADNGDWERAAEAADAALRIHTEAGLGQNAEMVLALRRMAHQARGELALARDVQRELVALMRRQGRTWTVARMIYLVADLSVELGEPAEAGEAARTAARLQRAAGVAVAEAEVLEALAAVALGDPERALALATPHLGTAARALEVVVLAAIATGDPAPARAALADAPDPLWETLLDAVAGRAYAPPAVPPDPTQIQSAWVRRLGGPPARRLHSPRARAIAAGDGDGPFPEAAALPPARSYGQASSSGPRSTS
ncbi:MAG: winged helix-turn-helix domain-containing protein [Myxococcota bacterium]